MDENHSENHTISLVLCFYAFFMVYYNRILPILVVYCLNYLSSLSVSSITLIKLVFWSTQVGTPIGTQCSQLTPVIYAYIYIILILPHNPWITLIKWRQNTEIKISLYEGRSSSERSSYISWRSNFVSC